jgi:ATP-dependent helicase/DNAse subunit B
MTKDKYSALWVSHSSINDFIACPRAYYLKNIYKDPHSGHKIAVVSPPLSLGQAVHEVIESLSVLPVDKRFDEPLVSKLDSAWIKVSGKSGGFWDQKTEADYKHRAREMLSKVAKNPGPLKNLAIKINMDLPYYWLSEEDNIILCGKIDWLEYLEDKDAVHIIDFKTGKRDESQASLQLPIYLLLVSNTQNRKVDRASYWYLERQDAPIKQKLPNKITAKGNVLKAAKEILLARKLNRFKCRFNGCPSCKPFEAIIEGKAEAVGVGEYKQDLYLVPQPDEKGSQIL